MGVDPAWLAALRTTERVSSIAGEEIDEPGAERLRAWSAQKPFARHAGLWEERLAEDGLSEAALGALLSEPLAALAARMPVPAWAVALEAALATCVYDGVADLAAAAAAQPNNYLSAVVRLVAPFTVPLVPAIRGAIAGAAARGVALDEARVLATVLRHVGSLAEHPMVQSVALEVNVARKRGLLADAAGATPEARFDHFIDVLADPDVVPSFWKRHPVLARHVLDVLGSYADVVVELFAHLGEDQQVLSDVLVPRGARLVGIAPGAGDTHRRGRTVMTLSYEPELAIVYKPRSADADAGYAAVAQFLAERAAEAGDDLVSLRTPRVVSWAERSYHELVESKPATTREELARYFTRQGVHLALLHVLGAQDMHAENMIAQGEHPVLIDLEALLQPRFRRLAGDVNPANEAAMTSVLRTLFLPMRVASSEANEGYDISALGAYAGQLGPSEVPTMIDVGTDVMRVVGQRPDVALPAGRPTLNGEEVDVAEWSEEIADGFARAFRVLARHKDALVAGPLQMLRDASVRVIPRATQAYITMLLASFHPSYLADALERERIFDRLYLPLAHGHDLRALIPSERADLHAGDVPFFTMKPASRDVVDASGRIIPSFFEEAPFDAAVARIRAMDERALRQELWIIGASFATIPMGKAVDAWTTSRTTLPPGPISRDELVARAVRIGDRLADLAIRHGDHVGWLGLDLAHERDWSIVASGTDLYTGGAGIALFLGQLGGISGETRFSTLAREAIATVLATLDARLAGPDPSFRVGALGELGGPLYALAHLGVLLSDAALLDRAARLLPALMERIATDVSFDVMEGAAGALLCALAFDAARPSAAAVDLARAAHARLVEGSAPQTIGTAWDTGVPATAPLGGFAHGTAGIATALHRLARRTGDPAARALANDALAYERSLHDPERDAWRDLRAVGIASASLAAWCHGAGGVTLAFAERGDLADDTRRAAGIVARRGFGLNHSLCHGDLGNLEALFVARPVLGDSPFTDRLGRVLASLDAQGPLSGVPLGVETPGLFVGLAGIGWQLLRFAEPARVPSVLTLEPPPR